MKQKHIRLTHRTTAQGTTRYTPSRIRDLETETRTALASAPKCVQIPTSLRACTGTFGLPRTARGLFQLTTDIEPWPLFLKMRSFYLPDITAQSSSGAASAAIHVRPRRCVVRGRAAGELLLVH